MPFDADQATIASKAYDRYGKGRHPAGLNFGDCFSYALSRATGEPLLFKGEDFTKTDALCSTASNMAGTFRAGRHPAPQRSPPRKGSPSAAGSWRPRVSLESPPRTRTRSVAA